MNGAVITFNRAREGRNEPDKAALQALMEKLRAGAAFVESIVRLSQGELQVCYDALENRPLTPEQQAVFDRHPALAAWKANQMAQAALVHMDSSAVALL